MAAQGNGQLLDGLRNARHCSHLEQGPLVEWTEVSETICSEGLKTAEVGKEHLGIEAEKCRQSVFAMGWKWKENNVVYSGTQVGRVACIESMDLPYLPSPGATHYL